MNRNDVSANSPRICSSCKRVRVIAIGVEARREKLKETSNADPSQPIDLTPASSLCQSVKNMSTRHNVVNAQGSDAREEAFPKSRAILQV